ncbi:MAG: hypothetical protein P8N43_11645 [Alphaproteobacteria bacterium]|nr:hypothetical protein [Alphaproteobacteria bacterium]
MMGKRDVGFDFELIREVHRKDCQNFAHSFFARTIVRCPSMKGLTGQGAAGISRVSARQGFHGAGI